MFVTVVLLVMKMMNLIVLGEGDMTLALTILQNPLIKFLGNPLSLHSSFSLLDAHFSFSRSSSSPVTWGETGRKLMAFLDSEFLPSSQDFMRLELHIIHGEVLGVIALLPSPITEACSFVTVLFW